MPFGGVVRGDGADGVEGLVTSVAFCEIDGWCKYYFWGLVTARGVVARLTAGC